MCFSKSRNALDHGFQTALHALTGLLLLGALIAIALVKPAAHVGPVDGEVLAFEEAA